MRVESEKRKLNRMIIRRTIAKEELSELPKAAFPGEIHVVQTPQEAERRPPT